MGDAIFVKHMGHSSVCTELLCGSLLLLRSTGRLIADVKDINLRI